MRTSRAGTGANCFDGHCGQAIRHFLRLLGEAIPRGLAQTERPVYRREEAPVRRKARGRYAVRSTGLYRISAREENILCGGVCRRS
jgi:hypothetical protein